MTRGQRECTCGIVVPSIDWVQLASFTSKPPNPHMQIRVFILILRAVVSNEKASETQYILVSLSLLIIIYWSYREWTVQSNVFCSREAALAKGEETPESYCVPFCIFTQPLLLLLPCHQYGGMKKKHHQVL